MGSDKDRNLSQVVEQTSIWVQRTQSELWKRLRKLALPIADHLFSLEKESYSISGRSLSKEQCNTIKLQVGCEGSMYAWGKLVDLFACHDSNSTFQYWMCNGTEKMLPFLMPYRNHGVIYSYIIFTGKMLLYKEHGTSKLTIILYSNSYHYYTMVKILRYHCNTISHFCYVSCKCYISLVEKHLPITYYIHW